MDRGRVLIVDDEPLIGTTLKVLLGADHDVMAATTGAAAQEILRVDEEFDVILCDLMMPGVSGIELHGWLADRAPALARRMVFMTGGAFTERARQFLDDVPNARVEKPFDPPALIRQVDQWVEDARRKRSSGELPCGAG